MAFQPGKSGNPSGRPRGIIDKRAKLREKLESHAEEIIDALVENAKAGDSGALKLCVDRLIPRVKADDGIVFELPEGRLDEARNMLQIVHAITQGVASGRLSLEDAFKFSNFMNNQCRIIRNVEDQINDKLEREDLLRSYEEQNEG